MVKGTMIIGTNALIFSTNQVQWNGPTNIDAVALGTNGQFYVNTAVTVSGLQTNLSEIYGDTIHGPGSFVQIKPSSGSSAAYVFTTSELSPPSTSYDLGKPFTRWRNLNLIGSATNSTAANGAAIDFSTAAASTVQLDFATNQATMAPDFTHGVEFISTNAAFTVLAPVGVSSKKTTEQVVTVNYTNTTAAVVVITPPANVHTVGTWNVTNWTEITYKYWPPSGPTNAYSLPVF